MPNDLPLLSSVQLQPTDAHRLASLQGDSDGGREGDLPRHQEVLLDCLVMLHPCDGDLVPHSCIQTESLAELALPRPFHGLHPSSGLSGSTAECMREGLVLCGNGCDGSWGRKGSAFEAGSSEVGDAVSDGCGELRDRLLDGSWVIIRLRVIDLCYSAISGQWR